MAAWICWNFTKPRPATSTANAETTIIIRLFMTSSLSPCSINVDAAFFDQRPGGAPHLGASHPVVGKSRDLIEPGSGQIVLARQHQEIRGEAGLVPVLFSGELNLGRLAPRAGRLDPLTRGLQRGRGVEDLRADRLPHAHQVRLGLPLDVAGDVGLRARHAVPYRKAQYQRYPGRVEVAVAERLELLREGPVEIR